MTFRGQIGGKHRCLMKNSFPARKILFIISMDTLGNRKTRGIYISILRLVLRTCPDNFGSRSELHSRRILFQLQKLINAETCATGDIMKCSFLQIAIVPWNRDWRPSLFIENHMGTSLVINSVACSLQNYYHLIRPHRRQPGHAATSTTSTSTLGGV